MTRRRAAGRVVLLSGGLDSSTVLALARARAGPLHALTIGYGQRHRRELRAARAIAAHFGVDRHVVLDLPLGPLLPSALTDRRRGIPARGRRDRIPATYVPARNTIFLALALGYAEANGLTEIWIGANAVDYSGYPDCRPAYLRAFEAMAGRATRAAVERGERVRIRAPLLRLSKASIVAAGERRGVPWGLTWSCYRGGRRPCGRCDSCLFRARGFRVAGIPDPLVREGGSRGR